MRAALERIVLGPVAAVRPYLALKATLLFLAFDMWVTRASHAGRYGAGGFNVAHFGWLDALQPDVSPAVYVGVCVFTGALCFAIAIGDRAPRWLVGVALLTHTWSWAMSMLDSYQHHYLLSLVLLGLMFVPPLTAEEALLGPSAPRRSPTRARERASDEASDPDESSAPGATRGRRKLAKGKAAKRARARRASESASGKKGGGSSVDSGASARARLFDPAPLTSAWAWTLLGGSIAVVYAYTALSKTDPEWLSGAALRSVLHLGIDAPAADAPDPLGPFRAVLGAFGVEGEPLWYLMGHGVVVVQMICAAGYLIAPLRDSVKSRALDAFLIVALLTALSFHLGAEYMELKIGWFSWYMIAYAAIFFLPARWLAVVARRMIPLRGGGETGWWTFAPGGVIRALIRLLVGFAMLYAGRLGEATLEPLVVVGALVLALPPLRWLARGLYQDDEPPPAIVYVEVVVGALAIGIAGAAVDLPGAQTAGLLVAGLLLVATALAPLKKGTLTRLGGYAIGVAAAAVALYVSVTATDVRWDYYRNVGGDHRRRGEIAEAYVAYVKANRYAPEGQDRRAREEEMRARLEAMGAPIPEVP